MLTIANISCISIYELCEAAATYRSAISVYGDESTSPKTKDDGLGQGDEGGNRGRGKARGRGGRGSRGRAGTSQAGMKSKGGATGGATTKKLKVDIHVKRPVLDVLRITPTISSNKLHAVLEAFAIDTPSTTSMHPAVIAKVRPGIMRSLLQHMTSRFTGGPYPKPA